METLVSLVILVLLLFSIKSKGTDQNDDVYHYEDVRVGLIMDLDSKEGKIFQTSLSLALSDFYHINDGYQTRVSVVARDSQGDPLFALAAGAFQSTDVLQTAQVKAIVGGQSLQEAKLLAAICNKSKVPVISALAPSSLSLNKYDNFIQLMQDSTSEAKGITSLIHDFKWKSIVVIYEDVDDWREGLQILLDHLQDEGVHIGRTVSFAESSPREEDMVNQLRKLKSSRASIFLVHMSEILVSRLFRCVEKLGMMEQGYAWILTARTMNHFHYSDHFAVSLMQGVIGFRSYIPESEELANFTSRLRKLMVGDEISGKYSAIISVWAHDIACILATSVEKISLRASDGANVSNLLETIRQSRLIKGFSHGEIQIVGKTFLSRTLEIVNMIETGERRICLWGFDNLCGTNELETIIWPSGSRRIPSHRFLAENGERKLLRVLVTSGNMYPHLVSVRRNSVTGFCIEVFKTSMEPFNYDLEFIPYDGYSYDKLTDDFASQKDKYGAAVGDISITFNRSLLVDFTLPYTDMGIAVLELNKTKKSMWTFFDPLEKSLWLASGAFFILTGFVVWLLERAVNPEFQGSWGQQLGTMLWFGFSTLVFAHREKLQKMSSRFLVMVWVFVVLILTSSYSANLTSTKTISHIQLSQLVNTPERIKDYRTAILNNFEDHAQSLRNGSVSYVVDEIPYLSILLGHYPGEFQMIVKESIFTNGFGFMFQKGSGLAPDVSREITKLRASGMLKDMERRWFQKLDSFTVNSNTGSSEKDNASKRLTIRELGGLFIIAGVAHALVIAVHLFQTRQDISRVLGESRLFTKLQSFSGFYK